MDDIIPYPFTTACDYSYYISNNLDVLAFSSILNMRKRSILYKVLQEINCEAHTVLSTGKPHHSSLSYFDSLQAFPRNELSFE